MPLLSFAALGHFHASHYEIARRQVLSDENVCIASYFLNEEKIRI
jgi:hypothetical protein